METNGFVRQNLNDSVCVVVCACLCVREKDYGPMQEGLLYFNSPFEMIAAD